MATALITGATAGIGLAIARALAAEGHDLILVARDHQRLDEVAAQLTQHGKAHAIAVTVLPADLADAQQLQRVADRLADMTDPIDICVNNAGLGVREDFLESDIEQEQLMIDVMVTAVMRLTHAVLPVMVGRQTGAIINVSSIAGWMPGGTYSAAKAWTTTFSESLHGQVKGSGVSVLAVCPGYTHTEFHQRAGMNVSSVPKFLWLDADDVAAQALRDARKGRAWSVAGRVYRAIGLGTRVLPRAVIQKATAAR